MRPKSVAEFIRDNKVSRSAQYDYREAAAGLRILAFGYADDDRQARLWRYYADLAERAARAEYFDPEPPGLHRA